MVIYDPNRDEDAQRRALQWLPADWVDVTLPGGLQAMPASPAGPPAAAPVPAPAAASADPVRESIWLPSLELEWAAAVIPAPTSDASARPRLRHVRNPLAQVPRQRLAASAALAAGIPLLALALSAGSHHQIPSLAIEAAARPVTPVSAHHSAHHMARAATQHRSTHVLAAHHLARSAGHAAAPAAPAVHRSGAVLLSSTGGSHTAAPTSAPRAYITTPAPPRRTPAPVHRAPAPVHSAQPQGSSTGSGSSSGGSSGSSNPSPAQQVVGTVQQAASQIHVP